MLGDTVRASVKTLDKLVNLIGEMIINKKRFEEKTGAAEAPYRNMPVSMASVISSGRSRRTCSIWTT